MGDVLASSVPDPVVQVWKRWVGRPFTFYMASHVATEATVELTLSIEEDLVEQEVLPVAMEGVGANINDILYQGKTAAVVK